VGKLRAGARNLALIFFGGFGAYIISFLFSAQLGQALIGMAARFSPARWMQVVMGMMALDLSKAPALCLCAVILAHAVTLSPAGIAVGLTATVYLFDLIMASLLHQAGELYGMWQVLLLRLGCAVALGLMVALVVRWRRRK